jgi:hypothetical protein
LILVAIALRKEYQPGQSIFFARFRALDMFAPDGAINCELVLFAVVLFPAKPPAFARPDARRAYDRDDGIGNPRSFFLFFRVLQLGECRKDRIDLMFVACLALPRIGTIRKCGSGVGGFSAIVRAGHMP